MRLFVLARHGQSVLNVKGLINGDPARDPGLSDQGVTEAQRLGVQLAGLALDVAVVSPFPRTEATARLALEGRDVRCELDADLGDIRIGDLDGLRLDDYRAAPAHSQRDVRFPGGESLNEAARRYVAALDRLVTRTEQTILVVTHEIPIRYALNAAGGSGSLDGPVHAIANASPYLFGEPGLRLAAARMRELAGGALDSRPGVG